MVNFIFNLEFRNSASAGNRLHITFDSYIVKKTNIHLTSTSEQLRIQFAIVANCFTLRLQWKGKKPIKIH